MSNFTNYFINLSLTFFSLIIVLLVLEGITRVLVNPSIVQYHNPDESWELDDTLGWKNKSNAILENHIYGQFVRFSTNVDGLRPSHIKELKNPKIKRVLLIGNSTVAGRAVNESETLHYYLDSLLNLNGNNFEVINAGVEGYATDQSLLLLKYLIPKYKPDFVFYGYCNNDLFANLKERDANLFKPTYKLINGKYSLILPKKNEAIIKQRETYQNKRLAITNSYLLGLLRPGVYKLKVALNKEQKIGDIDPYTYKNFHKYENEFHLLSFLIAEMNSECIKERINFAFYSHPAINATWNPYRRNLGITASPNFYEDRLLELSYKENIPFIEMVNDFLQNQDNGPFHLLPYDPHCNGKGYLMQATIIAKFIQKLPK